MKVDGTHPLRARWPLEFLAPLLPSTTFSSPSRSESTAPGIYPTEREGTNVQLPAPPERFGLSSSENSKNATGRGRSRSRGQNTMQIRLRLQKPFRHSD